MSNTTTTEVLQQIEQSAKANDPQIRMVRTLAVGEWVRQGDLNIQRIEYLPDGLTKTEQRQLAPGNTQGSRHVLEGEAKVYVRAQPGPLQGPLFELRERSTVTHPEHAHVSLPSGFYEATYQRDFEQEEIARVQD